MTNPLEDREHLVRRARLYITIFIIGLFVSGVTAFPLESELRFAVHLCDAHSVVPAGLSSWLHRVYAALADENARYPFLAYGTDCLAFAHIMIAILFLGAWQDPARNVWVLRFGLLACAGILPLALIAGPLRGIPFYWRLIDCSFGVFGALILFPAYRIARQLEARSPL